MRLAKEWKWMDDSGVPVDTRRQLVLWRVLRCTCHNPGVPADTRRQLVLWRVLHCIARVTLAWNVLCRFARAVSSLTQRRTHAQWCDIRSRCGTPTSTWAHNAQTLKTHTTTTAPESHSRLDRRRWPL